MQEFFSIKKVIYSMLPSGLSQVVMCSVIFTFLEGKLYSTEYGITE